MSRTHTNVFIYSPIISVFSLVLQFCNQPLTDSTSTLVLVMRNMNAERNYLMGKEFDKMYTGVIML